MCYCKLNFFEPLFTFKRFISKKIKTARTIGANLPLPLEADLVDSLMVGCKWLAPNLFTHLKMHYNKSTLMTRP